MAFLVHGVPDPVDALLSGVREPGLQHEGVDLSRALARGVLVGRDPRQLVQVLVEVEGGVLPGTEKLSCQVFGPDWYQL